MSAVVIAKQSIAKSFVDILFNDILQWYGILVALIDFSYWCLANFVEYATY